MPREAFNKIKDEVMDEHPFVHCTDCTGELGVFPIVKLVGCLRHLACGDACDREDENLSIGDTTLRTPVKEFCTLMIAEFGGRFLNRCPDETERRNLSRVNATRGFPGCLASWDCKHFTWENCPMRWAGHHKGHGHGNTLMLEAIADHRRHIWFANFGGAGSMNDTSALDRSSVVGAMLAGRLSLKVEEHSTNNDPRDWMHFLVDGMHPEWATFVSACHQSADRDKKRFAGKQEKVRKDVECAFGALVKKFHVLKRPLRGWFVEELTELVHCCVIIHNMIAEHKRGLSSEEDRNFVPPPSFALFGREEVTAEACEMDGLDLSAARSGAFNANMKNSWEHFKLKQGPVAHVNDFIDNDNNTQF